MKLILLIGLGGFLGSISRYLVHLSFIKICPALAFPVGTFTVNILGSLFLGMIYALSEHYKLFSDEMRLFLAVGFCGSFTTFSTLALESVHLLQQKEILIFASYIIASLALGLLAVVAGYYLIIKMV